MSLSFRHTQPITKLGYLYLNKVTMLITKSSINIVFQHNMCDLLKLENVATINVLLDENKKLIFRV